MQVADGPQPETGPVIFTGGLPGYHLREEDAADLLQNWERLDELLAQRDDPATRCARANVRHYMNDLRRCLTGWAE